MRREEVQKVIGMLYKGIDGFQVSERELKKLSYYYVGMVYDEVTDDSFFDILDKIENKKDQIFIDLGSGIGKKVFLSALYGGFKQSVGIEMVKGIYDIAENILDKFHNSYKFSIDRNAIRFVNNDFSFCDISPGNVFFLSLTDSAMEIELTGNLLFKLEQLAKGTLVVTTGFPVISPCYSVYHRMKCHFRRNDVDAYFSQKID